MNTYRLLDGSYTNDPDLYAEEWTNIGNRLAEAIGDGWAPSGFNPHIHLRKILPSGAWRTIVFDVDIAQRIITLHEGYKKNKAAKEI